MYILGERERSGLGWGGSFDAKGGIGEKEEEQEGGGGGERERERES
jgi:hypothetical protein